MEIVLKRKVVFKESSKELWGPLPWYKLLTKKEISRDRKEGDVDVYTDSNTNSDAIDIPIEDMKALIQKAEDAGANYIQIDYHCDHEEYDIYGSLITRPTEEEVAKRVSEEKKIFEKQKQDAIKRLQYQIVQVKATKLK